jgi:hypothetical protein
LSKMKKEFPDVSVKTGVRIAAFGLLAMFIVALLELIFVLDIIVSLGLYLLLKPVNKSLALLGAWFRVMYTARIGAFSIPCN